MSGPVPPENHDYYKQRASYRPTRITPAAAATASDRRMFIVSGLLLQALGGGIFWAGSSSSSTAAEVFGSVIAWVGAMLLFVGLVAVGVRLGTEELLELAQHSRGGEETRH